MASLRHWRRLARPGGPGYPEQVLTALGATPEEDRVYRYLSVVASAAPGEIAAAVRLPDGTVERLLDAMARRGLVTESGGRYAAAPPDAVEALLRDRLRELWSAQDALAELTRAYRTRQRHPAGPVEVVTGPELAPRIEHIQDSARSELLLLTRLPIITFDQEYVEANLLIRPQVIGRVVYDVEVLNAPGFLTHIERTRGPLDEYRACPEVPLKLLVADRSVAVVPLGHRTDSTPAVAVVHPSGVLDGLVALFEQVWSASLPLVFDGDRVTTASSPLGPDDRRLLSYLVAGLTDEAIAAHQGVSPRTIQRRVQALMLATGTRTRTQLAWQAATRGWLRPGYAAGRD
jgi:DNA-binding CsgD family transcriptional regulator